MYKARNGKVCYGFYDTERFHLARNGLICGTAWFVPARLSLLARNGTVLLARFFDVARNGTERLCLADEDQNGSGRLNWHGGGR